MLFLLILIECGKFAFKLLERRRKPEMLLNCYRTVSVWLFLLHMFIFMSSMTVTAVVVIRWLFNSSIVHNIRLLDDSGEQLVWMFFISLCGDMLSLYGMSILLLSKQKSRFIFISWAVLCLFCLALQSFGSVLLLRSLPGDAVLLLQGSDQWQQMSVNERLRFQADYGCCGYMDGGDRQVEDGYSCRFHRNISCSQFVITQERKGFWLWVQVLFCYLPPGVLFCSFIFVLILNYCWNRMKSLEFQLDLQRRRYLQRSRRGEKYTSAAITSDDEKDGVYDYDDDDRYSIRKWKRMLR